MSKIEIEFRAPRGRAVMFAPIDRALRGRIDFIEMLKILKGAASLANEWGDSLPGMRVSVDTATKEVVLIEPLHEPQFARIRELISKRGEKLVDAREVFPGAHLPTFLFWMARLTDSGLAQVTAGTLGTADQVKAQYGQPKLRTLAPVERDQTVDKLVQIMFSLLTDKQRADAGKLLAAGVA